ncbi:MAG TPA: energy transducer TonB [Gemmatimonadales bacterium]|nr:energy transducer TonB [Gemmatimonadales bacterium]
MIRAIPAAGLALPLAALTFAAACTRRDDGTMRLPFDRPARAQLVDGPPVALNAESPVVYPPAMLQQGVDATVVLRLYATAEGALVPESTRVAESSGYPALDSAAVAAAPALRFAPALRNGDSVAATFLQPVRFRHAQGGR